MKKQMILILALSAAAAFAQRVTDRRSAEIRGGGGEGKCTIEVMVDDVAEVEIIGNNAVIRTINGAPASFRRFQCNQAVPFRPSNFRFQGVDGRGRQEMVRSPEGGGPAIVRIEDSKGGAEGYTFDIFWSGSGGGGGYRDRDRGGYDNGRGTGIFGGNNNSGSGGYYGDRNDNNGWGSGNGWGNNRSFNFEGGRYGSGNYRERNGQTRRLDAARVSISDRGAVVIEFQSESGRIEFNGNVERRDGRRIYANVRGSGMYGTMEIEMSNQNTVRSMNLRDVGLTWNN